MKGKNATFIDTDSKFLKQMEIPWKNFFPLSNVNTDARLPPLEISLFQKK